MRRSVKEISEAFDRDGVSAVDPWELTRLTRWRRRAQDPKVIARDQARRNRLLANQLEES